MSFLRRVAGLSLRDRGGARTSEGAQSRAAAPWCGKEPVEAVGASDQDASPWRFSGHVQLVGDQGVDPQPAGGITYPSWPGDASGSPRRKWKTLLGRRGWSSSLSLLPAPPGPDKPTKWMDVDSSRRRIVVL